MSSGFKFELLYSARSGSDYDHVLEELGGFELLQFTEETWTRMLDAQRELAHVSAQRQRSFSAIDLLTAAAAAVAGVGVLHYDSDYDDIAKLTSLEFESRWIGERGTLDEDVPENPLRDRRTAFNARLNALPVPARIEAYDRLIAVLDEEFLESARP